MDQTSQSYEQVRRSLLTFDAGYNVYPSVADDYVKFVERRDILNLLLYSYMFVRTLFRTESNHVYSGFLGFHWSDQVL